MIQITRYPNGFPCTACGMCCKKIESGIENIKKLFSLYNIPLEEIDFNYKWDKNGKCEKLGKDGKCKVYNKRPNVCNISWVTNRLKLNPNLFYPEVIKVCNNLMDENDIDEKYRIK